MPNVTLAEMAGPQFPSSSEDWARRPYFIWEYAVTWAEFRDMLHGQDVGRRRWALSRLLRLARWDHVWRLVTIEDVARDLGDIEVPDAAFWRALVAARAVHA